MPYHFTNAELIVAAVALVVVVVIAVGMHLQRRKAKTAGLRNRFGSEYDRAIQEHGSSQKAEATLADRETHVNRLKIRELGAIERERFTNESTGFLYPASKLVVDEQGAFQCDLAGSPWSLVNVLDSNWAPALAAREAPDANGPPPPQSFP